MMIRPLSVLTIWLLTLAQICITHSRSSPLQPFIEYNHETELKPNISDLFWSVNDADTEITFELHVKTTGWIALGISPGGGMTGADIGVGWIDAAGKLHFQDRYAVGFVKPMIDNTTKDWFELNGREENGWTTIQFKRLIDTCDTMDVPIKSGTNILIFAYGLVDPSPDITYHDDRHGTRILPLRSYANPPSEDKFKGLDSFQFVLNNYIVPATDTTYHCKVYKLPSYPSKRHSIAHKIIVDPKNRDLVHHLLTYECDPLTVFDDANLPDDVCDKIYAQVKPCVSNIATGWAVGGDYTVEYTKQAGYPVGGDFPIKYILVQMHYDNRHTATGRTDSSGIRFYVGNELRPHDLGYLTFGTESFYGALAIPPRTDRFIVDSYCPANATKVIPKDGITVVSAFPHTHLQGRSLFTKLIRNETAVQYLFNADAYDFNYQFEHRLPKPVKLYPGDEFATRCIYSTRNKSALTLGGERTTDEMCLHMFPYYPRMYDLYGCVSMIDFSAWQALLNSTELDIPAWLAKQNWTSEFNEKWQEFFNDAPRLVISGRSGYFIEHYMEKLIAYKDLPQEECSTNNTSTTPAAITYPDRDPQSFALRTVFQLSASLPLIILSFFL